MSNFICENINLFNKKLLNNEKERINRIIEFIENLKECEKINKNDYIRILDKYNNIFKKEEIKRYNNVQIFNKTEEYLKDQINKMIMEEKNNFLITELELELERISLVKKML